MKRLIISLLSLVGLCVSCSDNDVDGVSFDSSVVKPAEDFTDPRDNNTYHCVQIGNQIWMAENLRYQIPGNSIAGCYTWNEEQVDASEATVDDETYKRIATEVANDPKYNGWPQYGNKRITGTQMILMMISYLDYGSTQEEVDEYLSYYPDYYVALTAELDKVKDPIIIAETHFKAVEKENGGYVAKYGFLYSFDGAKQAVPEGWRLPSDEDWLKLEQTLGLNASESLRNEAWRGSGLATLLSEGGQSGFNAKRAGGNIYVIKTKEYNYVNKNDSWYYWTSTSEKNTDGADIAIIRMSAKYTDKVWRGTSPVTTGYRDVLYSVRCVKDVK